MRHLTLFSLLGMLAGVFLAGCQDHPSMNTVTGPDGPSGALAPGVATADGSVLHDDRSGVVYTLSNDASENSILRFAGDGNGSLMMSGEFPTGGKGSGAGLGSQGSLVRRGEMFYAVNAGSDEISVLRESGGGLRLLGKVPSGGSMPISLTVHGDVLYVLDAGGAGNIAGFRGAGSGHLVPINGSIKPLSGSGVGPAQVEFNPDGRILVVTEKMTNKIDTYRVGPNGAVYGPSVQNSTGMTPFGFEFTPRGQLIVSDAFGGAAGQSALSSYRLGFGGSLNLITGPVQNGQAAACWVVVTDNGRFTYTTNAGTNNISGYRVRPGGGLVLLNDGGVTAATDASPIDMSLSNGSKVLYTLNAVGHSITAFRVNAVTGALTPLGKATGLPSSTVGLAAM